MRRLAAGLWLAMSTMAMAQPGPLAPVAWLAGGTWKAEVARPSGGPTTNIEQRMEWTLGGKAIRFVTKFNGVEQYEGFFTYDAVMKQILIGYPSASGDVARGVASEEPGGLLIDLNVSNADGTPAHYQVHIKKTGVDDYTWALYGNTSGTWSPMFEVKYHRAI